MRNRPRRPRGWLTQEEWDNRNSESGISQQPTYGADGKINGVCLNLGTSRSGGGGFFGGTRGTHVREHTRWSRWRDARWDRKHADLIEAHERKEKEFAEYLATNGGFFAGMSTEESRNLLGNVMKDKS